MTAVDPLTYVKIETVNKEWREKSTRAQIFSKCQKLIEIGPLCLDSIKIVNTAFILEGNKRNTNTN